MGATGEDFQIMDHETRRYAPEWENDSVARSDEIGIASWCLGVEGPDVFKRAGVLGFATLHLDYGTPGAPQCLDNSDVLETLRTASLVHGVSVGAIAVNVLNDLPLRHGGETSVEDLRRATVEGALAAAGRLGADLVVLPSFDVGAVRDHDDLDALARLCRFALDAAPPGVQIASENSLGVEESLELSRRVDHPAFRILLDTQNPMIFGHDPLALVDRLGPLICHHVHVKDGGRQVMGNAPLGCGVANVERTISALCRQGTAWTWILENEHDDVQGGAAHDLAWLGARLVASDQGCEA